MKKWIFIFFTGILVLVSCSDKKSDQPAAGTGVAVPADSGTADSSFMPVTSFLKGQLLALDSLPVTILQVTTSNNKSDSSWLSKEKVKPLLQPFITDLIDKKNLAAYFKESKFNDQSTDAITLTYDPKIALPDSILLRHWDVYIDPEKGTIKRVYILKKLNEAGGPYMQQLTWQTNKWAKIVTINNNPGSNPVQSEIRWVWDFNEK